MQQLDSQPTPGDAASTQAPGRPAPASRGAGVVLAAVLIGLGLFGAYRLLSGSTGGPAQAEDTARQSEPQIVRQGDQITVPQDSSVRNKLVIQAAAAKSIQRTLTLPAVVEADPGRTVKVATPLTGRVVNLMVQLGQRVTQGQELAVIDSGDLAQAYSDDEKAKTMLTLTKQVLDRQMGLEKSGGAAIKDREQAQSDYAQAKSELDRAENRLRSFGVSSDQQDKTRLLTLRAPMDGSVTDLQMAQGDFLNDPTATIMTISNLDTIWVTANVPEKDTPLVVNGQSAEVVFTAYPNETFKGSVLFVSDVLDPDTRRTKVRIAFDNKDIRLRPNMFANATFLAPTENLPVIPTAALVLRDEKDQVFVEVSPWVFEPRPVEVAFQQGDQAVVSKGLKPGDRVVVKDGVLLND